MQIYKSDNLTIDKIGSKGGEAYLVSTPESTLLYDSGFAYSAPAMVEELAAELDGRSLNYLFLSHSHYDHASGSVWVKERWPEAIVISGAHAAKVFERPGARETMKRLNVEAARQFIVSEEAADEALANVDLSLLDNLATDRVVNDGDVIDMGSVRLEVIEAPGHTRCSLMLWCPEERLLFSSETIGVYVDDSRVNPSYLVGYEESLAAIEKAMALQPEHILANHKDVLNGKAAVKYLENARYWAKETARLVWEGADQGKSRDELLALVKEAHYIEKVWDFWPEAAFDLNNASLVDLLLACKDSAA